MVSVVKQPDGSWRAYVCVDKKRRSKKERTYKEAYSWGVAKELQMSLTKENENKASFEDVAWKWWKVKSTQIKAQNLTKQILKSHILAYLNTQDIGDVKRKDLVEVVGRLIEAGKLETAHKVSQYVRQIFDHAVDLGIIEHHPASGLSRVIPSKDVKHHNALRLDELPSLMQAIDGYDNPVTRLALLLLAHTFVRTKELLFASWGEIKTDQWVIPPERMKMKGNRPPHVVPLSKQTENYFLELRELNGGSNFCFESSLMKGQPISNNTMLFALYRLGFRGKMTGHGFRTLASTWLNESGYDKDAIEKQLAHMDKNEIRATYNKAMYFDERARMMQAWSDFLDDCMNGKPVTIL